MSIEAIASNLGAIFFVTCSMSFILNTIKPNETNEFSLVVHLFHKKAILYLFEFFTRTLLGTCRQQ